MDIPKLRYSHILEPDRTLFQLYLATNPYPYIHLDFDVRVGVGRDPGPQFPKSIRDMAIHLSQRRIDCVAHTTDQIHIIEVTFNAGLTSLGQLLAYPSLYTTTWQPALPVIPILVCNAFQADVERLFHDNAITCHLIPWPS